MGASVLEELLPRRPAGIASDHWFTSLLNLRRYLLDLGLGLLAIVTLLVDLVCALLVALLVTSNASPLGRALNTLLLIGTVSARLGSYEGDELVYLCRVKSGLGLTHTSRSYVPPTCLSGILFRTSPPTKIALPRVPLENNTSWPCSQTR